MPATATIASMSTAAIQETANAASRPTYAPDIRPTDADPSPTLSAMDRCGGRVRDPRVSQVCVTGCPAPSRGKEGCDFCECRDQRVGRPGEPRQKGESEA